MTREEAKKIMENEVRCVRNPNCERLECRNCYLVMPEHTVLKAYEVAIKALEQEPCEDAISRQAAIDAVAFGITYATRVNMETGEVGNPFAESNQELRKAIHRICELPSVNPQPKTGHWIPCQSGVLRICSECKNFGDLSDAYCKHCGAKMVEPQESEE